MSTDIADQARAAIADRDRRMNEHVDAMGKQNPMPTLHAEMRAHWHAQHRLDELGHGLAGLCGYYGRDGQIPIAEISALLEAVQR